MISQLTRAVLLLFEKIRKSVGLNALAVRLVETVVDDPHDTPSQVLSGIEVVPIADPQPVWTLLKSLVWRTGRNEPLGFREQFPKIRFQLRDHLQT